jgi:hypothetical protein
VSEDDASGLLPKPPITNPIYRAGDLEVAGLFLRAGNARLLVVRAIVVRGTLIVTGGMDGAVGSKEGSVSPAIVLCHHRTGKVRPINAGRRRWVCTLVYWRATQRDSLLASP